MASGSISVERAYLIAIWLETLFYGAYSMVQIGTFSRLMLAGMESQGQTSYFPPGA